MQQHPEQLLRQQHRTAPWRVFSAGLLLNACFAGTLHAQANTCAATSCHAASHSRVTVLEPLLAERIQYVADLSPSFRSAWENIQQSGVKLRIGTDRQLHGALPRWYREHPDAWAGVTIASTDGGERLNGAVVVLRLAAMQASVKRSPRKRQQLLAEVDRVLIHEIYGHLAPIVAARDLRHECLDQHQPGEVACVQQREQQIALELAQHGGASAAAPTDQ